MSIRDFVQAQDLMGSVQELIDEMEGLGATGLPTDALDGLRKAQAALREARAQADTAPASFEVLYKLWE